MCLPQEQDPEFRYFQDKNVTRWLPRKKILEEISAIKIPVNDRSLLSMIRYFELNSVQDLYYTNRDKRNR